MSELNFPKNPAVGQEYTFNSLLYMFDGLPDTIGTLDILTRKTIHRFAAESNG